MFSFSIMHHKLLIKCVSKLGSTREFVIDASFIPSYVAVIYFSFCVDGASILHKRKEKKLPFRHVRLSLFIPEKMQYEGKTLSLYRAGWGIIWRIVCVLYARSIIRNKSDWYEIKNSRWVRNAVYKLGYKKSCRRRQKRKKNKNSPLFCRSKTNDGMLNKTWYEGESNLFSISCFCLWRNLNYVEAGVRKRVTFVCWARKKRYQMGTYPVTR